MLATALVFLSGRSTCTSQGPRFRPLLHISMVQSAIVG